MSYTQTAHHIVFATKDRAPVLLEESRRQLYGFIHGILRERNCPLHRMNGMEDHVHMLVSLHPTVSLAGLMREVKANSSLWIKNTGLFPEFVGWQSEYAAFAVSRAHRDAVIDYIKNQQDHHRNESAIDELRRLLAEEGIEIDPRYLHWSALAHRPLRGLNSLFAIRRFQRLRRLHLRLRKGSPAFAGLVRTSQS